MGNRINLRTIPGIEQGLYGRGSVDIKHLKLDLLEPGTIPSYSDILNMSYWMNGTEFSTALDHYNTFKQVLVNNQLNYVWQRYERKERSNNFDSLYVDGRGDGYGNMYLEKRFFGSLKPDADTSWISRYSKGYPLFEDTKSTYTARIQSFDTWMNNFISYDEIRYGNSKVFKKYLGATSEYPTLDVKANLYDIEYGWKWNPSIVKVLSSGDLILQGSVPVASDALLETDPLLNPALTPGFYKMDPETGEIDETFFIKNASGSRGVLNPYSTIYGIHTANDCIFIDTNDQWSSITFDDETVFRSRIYKIGLDGTIDTTFFPVDLSDSGNSYYSELKDVQFVNGKYYLCFLAYEGDYGTLLATQGRNMEIIRVDEDGSNPIAILKTGEFISNNGFCPIGYELQNSQNLWVSGLIGKPAIKSDGTIYAPCQCSQFTLLLKISANGEIDMDFTFKQVDASKYGRGMVYYPKYLIGYNVFGINVKLISDDSIMVWSGSENDALNILQLGYMSTELPNSNEWYTDTVIGKDVKVGKIFKVLANGDIDFDFNRMGDYFGNIIEEQRNSDWYNLGFHEDVFIKDVEEIDGKLYFSISNTSNNKICYISYNDAFNAGYVEYESTNLIRLNLDGSIDMEFNKIAYMGIPLVFKKNSKLFTYLKSYNTNETTVKKMEFHLDPKFDYYDWGSELHTRVYPIDTCSYEQNLDGSWTNLGGDFVSNTTYGTLFEIQENVIDTVNHFTLKGDNYYSSNQHTGNSYYYELGNFLAQTNEFTSYAYDSYGNSENWMTESDVRSSTNYKLEFIMRKYHSGLDLTPSEQRFIDTIHNGIVEYWSSPRWNKDLYTINWSAADAEQGYSGYNPLFQYIDHINLGVTPEMSMADIFGFSDINILSSVTMPTANISKLVDAETNEDIFYSHSDNYWYTWNSRTAKWDNTLGNFIYMPITEMKNSLNGKLYWFREICKYQSDLTFTNYHVFRASLDDYLERL